MMSPLHNVVTVGTSERTKLSPFDLPGEVKEGGAGGKSEKGSGNDDRIDETAMARVFNFPVCQIRSDLFVCFIYTDQCILVAPPRR